MERHLVERVYLETETLGSYYWKNKELVGKTMELPWKDNASNISCIPEGVYHVKKMQPGFGRDYVYFRFMSVPGRSINKALGMSSILIHPITYVKDLQGCIGVGSRFADLNKDGVPDMVESKKKLAWMAANFPDEFELEIRKKP